MEMYRFILLLAALVLFAIILVDHYLIEKGGFRPQELLKIKTLRKLLQ